MSEIHGYTQQGALARLPESVRGNLSESIGKLSELGVRGAPNQHPDVSLDLMQTAQARRSVRHDLEDTFGKPTEKARDISHELDMDAMGGRFAQGLHDRLEGLSPTEVKTLKAQLHYSGFSTLFSSSTPEDRLTTRAAVLSAFAQGASLVDTAKLRTLLDSSDTQTRKDVLAELNKPGADPTAIIAKLAARDSAPPPITGEQRQQLMKHLQDNNQLAYAGRAMQFISDGHLDLSKLSPDEAEDVKLGLVAIGAYTGPEIYRDINTELRSHAQEGTPLSPQVDTFARTARIALSHLPDFQGIVMRGGGSGWEEQALAKYVPGQRVTEDSFVSSSANGGFAGTIQFVIESHHGKDISDVSAFGGPRSPDGREVLFAPGTQFDVLDRTQGTNDKGEQVLYIVLREVG